MRSYGILFKKTQTAKAGKKGLVHDLNYLNPESKEHESRRLVQEDMAYISKILDSEVRCYGYIRDEIAKVTKCAPETLDNDERIAMITNIMTHKTLSTNGPYRGKYVGHKLVFSLSKDLENKCKDVGFDPAYMMQNAVKTTMNKWRNKWHKGDQFGYATGVHNDTDHLHIHVYLHNRTRDGKYISCSQRLSNRECSYKQKDQINFIKDNLESFVRNLEKKIKYSKSYNYEKEYENDLQNTKDISQENNTDNSYSENKINDDVDVRAARHTDIFEKRYVVAKYNEEFKKIKSLEKKLNNDFNSYLIFRDRHKDLINKLHYSKKRLSNYYDNLKSKNRQDISKDDYKDKHISGHILRLIKSDSDTYSDWYNNTLGGHITRSLKMNNKKSFIDPRSQEIIDKLQKNISRTKEEIHLLYRQKTRAKNTYNDLRKKYRNDSKKLIRSLYLDSNTNKKLMYFSVLKSIKYYSYYGRRIDKQKEWLNKFDEECFDSFNKGELDDIKTFNIPSIRSTINSLNSSHSISYSHTKVNDINTHKDLNNNTSKVNNKGKEYGI